MNATSLDARIPVFTHEKISVWYHPGVRIIHHQVHAPVFGEVFRAALTKGIQAMAENRGVRWLSDDRNNGALTPDDFEWVDKTWYPQTVKAGWRFWALLPPASVVGQMNIRRHIALWKERGITVDVFTDLEKAYGWLASTE